MKNEFILFVILLVVVTLGGILAMASTTAPTPTTRNVDIIIGILCPQGLEIVTNRWDNSALDGCSIKATGHLC